MPLSLLYLRPGIVDHSKLDGSGKVSGIRGRHTSEAKFVEELGS